MFINYLYATVLGYFIIIQCCSYFRGFLQAIAFLYFLFSSLFNALNGFANLLILELFEFMYIFPTVCSAVYEISFDRLLFDCVISADTKELQGSIFNFSSYFFFNRLFFHLFSIFYFIILLV